MDTSPPVLTHESSLPGGGTDPLGMDGVDAVFLGLLMGDRTVEAPVSPSPTQETAVLVDTDPRTLLLPSVEGGVNVPQGSLLAARGSTTTRLKCPLPLRVRKTTLSARSTPGALKPQSKKRQTPRTAAHCTIVAHFPSAGTRRYASIFGPLCLHFWSSFQPDTCVRSFW